MIEKLKPMSDSDADQHIQDLPENESSEHTCPVCYERFTDLTNIVLGRCCKHSNFHRTCLTRCGLNYGLLKYKCPLCAGKIFKLYREINYGLVRCCRFSEFKFEFSIDAVFTGRTHFCTTNLGIRDFFRSELILFVAQETSIIGILIILIIYINNYN